MQNEPQRKLATRPGLDVRKHPVHGILERSDPPTIIFLTACTKDRTSWLADLDVHNLIRTCWLEADAWKVGRYVLMPDHLHLFASPGTAGIAFDNWVRYWKSLMTRALRDPGRRWQTDHWDTRMRSAKAYAEKWDYVRHNPVRQGLVSHPAMWRYQGELNRLRWDPEE